MDSIYLLPVFGIEVDETLSDAVFRLIDDGHNLVVNEVSIFECVAKAAKLIARGELEPKRLSRGLLGINYSPLLVKVDIYDVEVTRVAAELRRFIRDFIGCMILATAAVRADVLLTEDERLVKLSRNLSGYLRGINPKLRTFTLRMYMESLG